MSPISTRSPSAFASDRSLPGDPRWSSSAIRDLLVHAQAPGIISLAGGLPAGSLLPVEHLGALAAEVFDREGPRSLQYGPTAGEPELRSSLAETERVDMADLVITTGSQQALDLVTRAMTRPGDVVIVEEPGYVGAIQVLRANGVRLIGCPVDAHGLDTEALAAMLVAGARPTMVYVNPHHQNPTGSTLHASRRNQLLDLADRHGFLIVADDPYREISFDSAVPTADAGLHPVRSDRVVLLGSLSKTLSPGLRIGWCSGPRQVMQRIESAKQAADLHTATFNQLLASSALDDHAWFAGHLDGLRSAYRHRRTALVDAVSLQLPGASITDQTGGFFLWLDLAGIDTTTLLDRALAAGVAFVPGSAFQVDRTAWSSALRLSYSYADVDSFDEAVRRLAEAIH